MLVRFGENYVNPAHISALVRVPDKEATDIYVGGVLLFRHLACPEEIINEIRTALMEPADKHILTGDTTDLLNSIGQEISSISTHLNRAADPTGTIRVCVER